MNLEEYKLRKLDLKREREDEYKTHRVHCLKCMRPQRICFCHSIKSFETFFTFRILMHPKEAKKENIGTGRLTDIALLNSKIIVGENFDNDEQVKEIINGDEFQSFLLYPGDESINLSTTEIKTYLKPNKKPLIFILDGTWPCAKSMMRDSKCLHGLPRVSFTTEAVSRFKIKHQPAKYCLSTIESVYEVLIALKGQGIEKPSIKEEELLIALDKLVQFQIKCANDPKLKGYRRNSGSYRSPEKRIDSKKWEKRKICFEKKAYHSQS